MKDFIPTIRKFIPICDSCSGRDKCPIPEKEKQTKASCPDELSNQYFLKILPTWERPSYKGSGKENS